MTAPDTAGLEAAVHQRADALGRGDREMLESLMHPDAVWTTHTGLVLERDAYIARNTSQVKWRKQDVRVERLRIDEGIGIVLAIVDDVVDGERAAERFTMRVTLVWRHYEEHGWRLLAAHAGPRTRPQDPKVPDGGADGTG